MTRNVEQIQAKVDRQVQLYEEIKSCYKKLNLKAPANVNDAILQEMREKTDKFNTNHRIFTNTLVLEFNSSETVKVQKIYKKYVTVCHDGLTIVLEHTGEFMKGTFFG